MKENNNMSFGEMTNRCAKEFGKKLDRSMMLASCNTGIESIMYRMQFEIEDLTEQMKTLTNTAGKLIDLASCHRDSINSIYDDIYDLCPEKDIIDTMADSEEERLEMIRRVMNVRSLDDVTYEMHQEWMEEHNAKKVKEVEQ